ncbi:hypothetical protein [Roseateles flavus]|uniref:DUF4238 domain-containing protein n=1 Tax=Roseateles flavus TaxID=3149041 RepID=A0ABV0GGC3_9BURK
MARYERTQPGNPHQLTIRQHLLPSRTISRFCGRDGLVHMRLSERAVELRLRPDNHLFCTMRSWDQRAESGFGKAIEDGYQVIADRLVSRSLTSLAADMHGAITEMYLLWRYRCLRARDPLPDLAINGVTGNPDLDLDAQEQLEKSRVMFIKPDGTLPGRVVAGMMLQSAIDSDWESGAHAMRWGVFSSGELEFLVPDAFIDQPILPVAPGICLAAGASDAELTLEEVARVNREAVRAASKYWFVHDVVRCPVMRATAP